MCYILKYSVACHSYSETLLLSNYLVVTQDTDPDVLDLDIVFFLSGLLSLQS